MVSSVAQFCPAEQVGPGSRLYLVVMVVVVIGFVVHILVIARIYGCMARCIVLMAKEVYAQSAKRSSFTLQQYLLKV